MTSGWAKWQRARRAKVGDEVYHRKKYWIIQYEHGNRRIVEERMQRNIEHTKSNPNPYMPDYEYCIRTTNRSRNYQRYKWFQLLRRKVETE